MKERGSIHYGEQAIEFIVFRRDRKTLEIAVEPDATVVIAAPLDAEMADIKAKVRKRAAWIRRQQRFFVQYLPRTPERQFLGGETHLYLGRQYRLKVIPHIQAKVTLVRGFIMVQTHQPTKTEVTRALVENWYRERAKAKFAERLEVNVLRFAQPDRFRPKGLIIRHIRQRWGSMSSAGRLLLNCRLIEAPTDAIDYVITHELCHLSEPNHGPAFYELLTSVLPDWQKRKDRLERIMS